MSALLLPRRRSDAKELARDPPGGRRDLIRMRFAPIQSASISFFDSNCCCGLGVGGFQYTIEARSVSIWVMNV